MPNLGIGEMGLELFEELLEGSIILDDLPFVEVHLDDHLEEVDSVGNEGLHDKDKERIYLKYD